MRTLDLASLSSSHVPHASTSLHAALALLEAHVRLACCISVATCHHLTARANWPSRRGLVGETSALRENHSQIKTSHPAKARAFAPFLTALDSLQHHNLDASLRNRAQHGKHLPEYHQALPAINQANAALAEALKAGLEIQSGDVRFDSLVLKPFVILDSPQLAILENWEGETGIYWLFGAGPKTVTEGSLDTQHLAGISFPQNLHRIHRMIRSILRDIDAIGGTILSEDSMNEQLHVEWSQPVLEGEKRRLDVFRLGAAPEWLDNNKQWRPFRFFVMDALHWGALLPRLCALAQAALERRIDNHSRLSCSFTRFRVALANEELESATDNEIRDHIVASAEAEGRGTTIVFLEGTAGAGKSVAMAACALDINADSKRAYESHAVKPAALFVSSEGHLMANIDTAIARVVDATPGLSASTAKLLVRHGLLVLFVDGLDELLGDASYRHAIERFNSWASGLGGRGSIVASARSSYFATTYLAAESTNDTLVTPELWRLNGLTDEQIQGIWNTTNASACFDIDRLSAQSRQALRIPFLCFEAAQRFSETVGTETAVRDSLIQGYLEREARLLSPEGGGEVTTENLTLFLREIAEMLVLSGDRTLSSADLDLAAAAAGFSHEHILNRLKVLCGLSVTRDTDKPRFVFEHEFYFDHFYALAVRDALLGASLTHVQLLNSRTVEPWALEPLVSGLGHQWCSDWLSQPYSEPGTNPRLTRGHLFLRLKDLGAAPDTVFDVAFGSANLTGWSGSLNDVEAEVLEIGTGIAVNSGSIRCLAIPEDATDVTVDLVATRLKSLRAGQAFLVGDEVRKFFTREPQSGRDLAERHPIQLLLSELDRRQVHNPVVFEPSFAPNDDRLTWIEEGTWDILMTCAQDAHVVEMAPIPSRGNRNAYRLRFRPSILELADRSSGDSKVQSFWKSVGSRC